MRRFGWVGTVALAVACAHSAAQEPSRQVSPQQVPQQQVPPEQLRTIDDVLRARRADAPVGPDRSLPAETLDVPPSRYVVLMGPAEVASPAIRSLALELDAIVATVAARLDTSPEALLLAIERHAATAETTVREPAEALRLRIGVRPSPPPSSFCPPRGAVAYPSHFVIYVTDRTTIEQLRGVAAHELGHLVSLTLFDGALHGTFGEGFATWVAGGYWTDWQGVPSFGAAVRGYRAAGTYLALGTVPAFMVDTTGLSPEARDAACLARRDVVYTSWAGLVEHLVAEHGLPKVIEFMRYEGPRDASVPPLDYGAAFGGTLPELEQAWLGALAAREQ